MRYLNESHRDTSGTDLMFVPAAERADAMDCRAQVLAPVEPAALGRWTRRVVVATAVWSVFELPFEIWVSQSTRDAAACVIAKLLWVALVGFVLSGSRMARIVYAFLCTIGLMAVAFGLPVEYRVFPLGFVLSSVECLLKATAFVCIVSAGVYPDEE
jgi:glucose dehydrogenase